MSNNIPHYPYTVSEAKNLIESEEMRLKKKSASYLKRSHTSNFIAASIAGLLFLNQLSGHPSSYTAIGIISIGILLYKGFDWLWLSQLTSINMTEYMQDNRLRPLTNFEIIELKHFVEPNRYLSIIFAQWQKQELIIRVRDKHYLHTLMNEDAGIASGPIHVQGYAKDVA